MSHSAKPIFRTTHLCEHKRARSCGFTLIELMVAVAIAMFLIGGLLVMVQSTKTSFTTQQQLAQLQDNERLAITFMSEIIESAGYFPNPTTLTSTAAFPVVGLFAQPGQSVYGTHNAAVTVPDTVTVRFAAATNDNIFNCAGKTNTTASTDTFTNTFWIDTTNPNNPVLTCTFSSISAPTAVNVPLVNGVKNLKIQFGVRRSNADTQSCTDTYLNAGQMPPTVTTFPNDWTQVCTVKITLSLVNPLFASGTGPATINITRVIAVMNWAGVNS
jgi:type IV pilus assembly protein PilW